MKILGSILSQKNLVVRRTTRPQYLVVLTFFWSPRTRGRLNFATLVLTGYMHICLQY